MDGSNREMLIKVLRQMSTDMGKAVKKKRVFGYAAMKKQKPEDVDDILMKDEDGEADFVMKIVKAA